MRRIPKTAWVVTLLFLLILIPFFLFGERIEVLFDALTAEVESHPWMTGCLLFFALGLDVFLPVPSSLASTLCGYFFGLAGGFLISFGAMTFSCLVGWGIAAFFAPWARRMLGDEVEDLERFFRHYGMWVLVALRTIPVLAEASVLFAGLLRLPFRQSFLYLTLGNAVVSGIYAVIGAWGHSIEAMIPAFLASCLISGVLFLIPRWCH